MYTLQKLTVEGYAMDRVIFDEQVGILPEVRQISKMQEEVLQLDPNSGAGLTGYFAISEMDGRLRSKEEGIAKRTAYALQRRGEAMLRESARLMDRVSSGDLNGIAVPLLGSS